MTARVQNPKPAGRHSKYQETYCAELIEFCGQGYSLTAFAGEIGVSRSTISEWCREYPEFSLAVSRAKAKRARWWEDQARQVAQGGGPGGQATMVIFGLKNHAPDDYREKQEIVHSGNVSATPFDPSQLSAEELDQLEALLRKGQPAAKAPA